MKENENIQKLKADVIRMSEFCTIDGIADSLKIPEQTVKDILAGKEIEFEEVLTDNKPVIQVKTHTKVLNQKVIAVCRAKGGVGATLVALTLSKLISENMKTLLICLNFQEGGSDLPYYTGMEFYPQIGLPTNLLNSVQKIQNNLYVMQPLTHVIEQQEITPKNIQDLLTLARQEFGQIIIDLPNNQDICTLEAIKYANILVMVMATGGQEGYRLAKLAEKFSNKEQIVVANMGLTEKSARGFVPVETVIEIPFDKSVEEKLKKQLPLSVKSSFYQGVKGIYEEIFQDEAPEGKFNELMYRLKAGFKKIRKARIMGKIRGMLGTGWDYAGNILWVLATLMVIVVALENYTDVQVPFAHAFLDKMAAMLNTLFNGRP